MEKKLLGRFSFSIQFQLKFQINCLKLISSEIHWFTAFIPKLALCLNKKHKIYINNARTSSANNQKLIHSLR